MRVFMRVHRVQAGKHHALDVFKARQRLGAGSSTEVIVSPTLVSATFLMVATKKPTSPAESSASSTGFGVITPMLSTSNILPFDMTLIFSPLRSLPFTMRASTITPRYASNQLSKISACSGASGSPLRRGSSVTTASRISATFKPVFAETAMASLAGRPDRLLDHLLGALNVRAAAGRSC